MKPRRGLAHPSLSTCTHSLSTRPRRTRCGSAAATPRAGRPPRAPPGPPAVRRQARSGWPGTATPAAPSPHSDRAHRVSTAGCSAAPSPAASPQHHRCAGPCLGEAGPYTRGSHGRSPRKSLRKRIFILREASELWRLNRMLMLRNRSKAMSYAHQEKHDMVGNLGQAHLRIAVSPSPSCAQREGVKLSQHDPTTAKGSLTQRATPPCATYASMPALTSGTIMLAASLFLLGTHPFRAQIKAAGTSIDHTVYMLLLVEIESGGVGNKITPHGRSLNCRLYYIYSQIIDGQSSHGARGQNGARHGKLSLPCL
jgi:hypothetical protein